MIKYIETTVFKNMSFNEYLSLEGISNSSFSNDTASDSPSEAVSIGTLVDAMLTQPEKADINSKHYNNALIAVNHIKDKYPFILKLENQLSFQANVEFGNYNFKLKGRPDFVNIGSVVVDLKVTQSDEQNYNYVIKLMNYEASLWNYAKALNCNKAYLLVYFWKLKKSKLIEINLKKNNDTWIERLSNLL